MGVFFISYCDTAMHELVAESVVDQEWMDGHWRGVAEGNWEISQHCQR